VIRTAAWSWWNRELLHLRKKGILRLALAVLTLAQNDVPLISIRPLRRGMSPLLERFKDADFYLFFCQGFALFVEGGIIGSVVLLKAIEAGERIPTIP
jgi:hypothetical protein